MHVSFFHVSDDRALCKPGCASMVVIHWYSWRFWWWLVMFVFIDLKWPRVFRCSTPSCYDFFWGVGWGSGLTRFRGEHPAPVYLLFGSVYWLSSRGYCNHVYLCIRLPGWQNLSYLCVFFRMINFAKTVRKAHSALAYCAYLHAPSNP